MLALITLRAVTAARGKSGIRIFNYAQKNHHTLSANYTLSL